MNEKPISRIFGLDLLRSLAIILVVMEHSRILISQHTLFPFIPLPDGVDLFFVLSGFLVGTILIKTTTQSRKFDLEVAFGFLKRRWFRTLPNYFLFLLINILLIYFGLINGYLNKYLVTFFVFMQNFYKPYDFLFWESWSLSVEEWFYLGFPLIMIIIFKVSKYRVKAKQVILSTILLFLVFPLVYRLYQAGLHIDFDLYFRKLVLTRIDTIGFGLLGAYIHWYHKRFWESRKNLFFILGIALLALLVATNNQPPYFVKTFFYSCIGFAILLTLPKLQSIKEEKIPLKPFRFISKISYSMYLVHLPLLQVISKTINFSGKFESVVIYLLFWLLTIVLSYIVYKIYENPIMNLRDRSIRKSTI